MRHTQIHTSKLGTMVMVPVNICQTSANLVYIQFDNNHWQMSSILGVLAAYPGHMTQYFRKNSMYLLECNCLQDIDKFI